MQRANWPMPAPMPSARPYKPAEPPLRRDAPHPPSRPALGPPGPATRPRSPDRQASLARRRRQAMSGIVPAKIAAAFTMAELAVLTVIARQCHCTGVCTLHIEGSVHDLLETAR